MSRQSGPLIDVKKQYVRMALESGNAAFIARKVGVSSSTLNNWIAQFREEVEADMVKDGVGPLTSLSTKDDLKKKYDQAMKLLGEKELEVAMLREMLKKKLPNFPTE
ncbi:MAG: hypothetical protein K0S34_452 [Bacillales bacterium]|jgi:transposase-like protein|nr:hypothetical protein [Bacillales bacterium]